MKINLPNQITLSRLVVSAAFFALLTQYSIGASSPPSLLYVCLAMFLVAAISDYWDGYYARKRGEVTALGRVLDPFVDKVLVCGAFVLLAGPAFSNKGGANVTGLESWMVVIILSRELLVTGLRGFSESRGVQFGAEFVGKAKMWTQTITVSVLLLTVAIFGADGGAVVEIVQRSLVWLTVVVTATSLLTYLVKARGIFSEASPS